jgi:Flp pilus assembly protein TadG
VRRHRARTRGAVTLETAIVTPFLLLLLFGIAEFGLAWTSGNRLEGAVSTAARTGSVSGSLAEADNHILMSLRASLDADLRNNVERVIVFRSDRNGSMNSSCRTTTPGTGVSSGFRCNVYSQAQLNSAGPTTPLPNGFWPPTSRQDRLADTPAGPDYIGVTVITRHDDVTNTFWRNGFRLERTSIYRIQPDLDG